MAPTEFSLRLQHGIAGGFAPPTPSAIYTVTATGDNTLRVASAIRPDGTPSLQDAAPKSLHAADPRNIGLVDELHAILKSIPTEYPPGSQDIYGMDTSIAFGSDDFMWVNGGPQGCGGGFSETQATDEDKAKFARAIEIVKILVDSAQPK